MNLLPGGAEFLAYGDQSQALELLAQHGLGQVRGGSPLPENGTEGSGPDVQHVILHQTGVAHQAAAGEDSLESAMAIRLQDVPGEIPAGTAVVCPGQKLRLAGYHGVQSFADIMQGLRPVVLGDSPGLPAEGEEEV